MYLTDEQKQEIVDHNINICKQLLMKSDMINKGRHTHDINMYASWIRNGLKDWGDKIIYGSKEFETICNYKTHLASEMYLAEHGL